MRDLNRRQVLNLAGISGFMVLATGLAACSNVDPLADGGGKPITADVKPGDKDRPLVIGSSKYYSAGIIAEIFAQVLEAKGIFVSRQYNIGARPVFLKEFEAGKIDLMPEYGGNLLQYYRKDSTAVTTEEIREELKTALPAGITALDFSSAVDQDSYCVTDSFAINNAIGSLADLTRLGRPIKVAANSELAERPYGPIGLKEKYGLEVELTPIEDGGGPLTVKALKDGTVDMANVYSADPAIRREGLVPLADPKNLIVAQNILAIASNQVSPEATAAINEVLGKLDQTGILGINYASVVEQKSAEQIAADWIANNL
ncbi:ABC transporter substrate-binding protein [Gleimia sp. 6138-11-ORH1]|uniref:ABC transporter substrate-binding protein n=1 Tax=Gleimia sp. 6138-11-ORH1 TaxID=2973937 RepID=UPI00216AB27E|nr:ABC transporter substrate-binding protein [Gleimia sp. 6138-11-ORH1]MCS4485260.1 ABC transporter substrate-binding protein [Gleimia sp. 6138-11-ORH1]